MKTIDTDVLPTRIHLSPKRPGTLQMNIPSESLTDVLEVLQARNKRLTLEVTSDNTRRRRRRRKVRQTKAPGKAK